MPYGITIANCTQISLWKTVIIPIVLLTCALIGAGSIPVIDGIVSGAEYDSAATFGGGKLNVYWSIIGEEIFLALKGETGGWIALGIEPTRAMKDADMIIGWVDGGGVSVIDAYSMGLTGPHPPRHRPWWKLKYSLFPGIGEEWVHHHRV